MKTLNPNQPHAQVLGRNLEALITRAEELKRAMKDDFTSVEHLVLAFPDDARFGRDLLSGEGVDAKKLEAAVKDIRGSNRVTDQVRTGGSLRLRGGRGSTIAVMLSTPGRRMTTDVALVLIRHGSPWDFSQCCTAATSGCCLSMPADWDPSCMLCCTAADLMSGDLSAHAGLRWLSWRLTPPA